MAETMKSISRFSMEEIKTLAENLAEEKMKLLRKSLRKLSEKLAA